MSKLLQGSTTVSVALQNMHGRISI